ncbi:MAG: YitT family protein, partial [Bacteroidales bacterium]|nr:YitT family protein [Bacteroidales bacterium]
MKDILRYLTTFKFWKELFIMTLGMMIAAAAVYYFMIPSKLVLGSISGLSIVISNLFGLAGITVKVSVVVMAINAILLIMAWILIGKEFGAKTVYTAMILGPLLEFWEKVLPYEKLIEPGMNSVMGEPLLDLLCFVLVVS